MLNINNLLKKNNNNNVKYFNLKASIYIYKKVYKLRIEIIREN